MSKNIRFNHIRELHHSQTVITRINYAFLFNHIRELHHSQTPLFNGVSKFRFNHIRELHHSQTDHMHLFKSTKV